MSEGKSAKAYRTISEVAESLGVPQHVLRFWETKFPAVKPLKRGGNRRYYRPEDVELLQVIHRLLHVEGYTIKGAQKLLKERGVRPLVDALLNSTTGASGQPVPLALAAAGADPGAAALATDDITPAPTPTPTPTPTLPPSPPPAMMTAAATAAEVAAEAAGDDAGPVHEHLNGEGLGAGEPPVADAAAAGRQHRAAVVEELRAIRARLAEALGAASA
ncbi:MerR family transcriptional regulator [Pedomonas sp. V897]|uniref:MerR family transcriptional regulator n=1 Tax=Pedomonas sp. V897 TaxID=3446482 RepID=UPI003EE055C1